jgi:ABC-2 type transport system permease protein
MSRTLAIAGRELRAFLLAPGGYVIMAMFLLFTGLLLFVLGPVLGSGFAAGKPASLRVLFSGAVWVLLLVAPAVTMRSVSEELRLGTFESLMTSPISAFEIVLGKFLGALGYLCAALLPTVLYVIAFERYGQPDYGELACGYLGMLLAGSAFLASGVLASTLTPSQVLAYLLTMFFWLLLLVGTKGLPLLSQYLGTAAAQSDSAASAERAAQFIDRSMSALFALDPHRRLDDFSIGLLDTGNVVYFVVLTALFLAAAVASVAMRRLR